MVVPRTARARLVVMSEPRCGDHAWGHRIAALWPMRVCKLRAHSQRRRIATTRTQLSATGSQRARRLDGHVTQEYVAAAMRRAHRNNCGDNTSRCSEQLFQGVANEWRARTENASTSTDSQFWWWFPSQESDVATLPNSGRDVEGGALHVVQGPGRDAEREIGRASCRERV